MHQAVREDLDELMRLGDGVDAGLAGVGKVEIWLPDPLDQMRLVHDQMSALEEASFTRGSPKSPAPGQGRSQGARPPPPKSGSSRKYIRGDPRDLGSEVKNKWSSPPKWVPLPPKPNPGYALAPGSLRDLPPPSRSSKRSWTSGYTRRPATYRLPSRIQILLIKQFLLALSWLHSPPRDISSPFQDSNSADQAVLVSFVLATHAPSDISCPSRIQIMLIKQFLLALSFAQSCQFDVDIVRLYST